MITNTTCIPPTRPLLLPWTARSPSEPLPRVSLKARSYATATNLALPSPTSAGTCCNPNTPRNLKPINPPDHPMPAPTTTLSSLVVAPTAIPLPLPSGETVLVALRYSHCFITTTHETSYYFIIFFLTIRMLQVNI